MSEVFRLRLKDNEEKCEVGIERGVTPHLTATTAAPFVSNLKLHSFTTSQSEEM